MANLPLIVSGVLMVVGVSVLGSSPVHASSPLTIQDLIMDTEGKPNSYESYGAARNKLCLRGQQIDLQ